MANDGVTGIIGTTKDKQDDKDFHGPGIEGEKTVAAKDTCVVTGEDVLRNMRAQGQKV